MITTTSDGVHKPLSWTKPPGASALLFAPDPSLQAVLGSTRLFRLPGSDSFLLKEVGSIAEALDIGGGVCFLHSPTKLYWMYFGESLANVTSMDFQPDASASSAKPTMSSIVTSWTRSGVQVPFDPAFFGTPSQFRSQNAATSTSEKYVNVQIAIPGSISDGGSPAVKPPVKPTHLYAVLNRADRGQVKGRVGAWRYGYMATDCVTAPIKAGIDAIIVKLIADAPDETRKYLQNAFDILKAAGRFDLRPNRPIVSNFGTWEVDRLHTAASIPTTGYAYCLPRHYGGYDNSKDLSGISLGSDVFVMSSQPTVQLPHIYPLIRTIPAYAAPEAVVDGVATWHRLGEALGTDGKIYKMTAAGNQDDSLPTAQFTAIDYYQSLKTGLQSTLDKGIDPDPAKAALQNPSIHNDENYKPIEDMYVGPGLICGNQVREYSNAIRAIYGKAEDLAKDDG